MYEIVRYIHPIQSREGLAIWSSCVGVQMIRCRPIVGGAMLMRACTLSE